MRLLTTLIAALLVPSAALAVASLPFWDLGVQSLNEGLTVAYNCLNYTGKYREVVEICDVVEQYSYLGAGSVFVASIGIALIVFVSLASTFTGFSRLLLSLAFPLVAFVALVFCGVIALGQAALLAAALYLIEIYFLGSYHPYIIGLVAITGALVGLGVIWRALQMFHTAKSGVIGIPLRPADAPHLIKTIRDIGRALGTRPPDNIVAGFDPTFFATSAKVITPFDKKPLRGETLYLSLPLMRMLSRMEVKSIIGHELAHFSGADTIYSKRFAPAYRGLYEAIQELSLDRGGSRGVLSLPANIVIQFVLSSFERYEKRISRKRELRADGLGAEAGSPAALCSALVKLSVLSEIWRFEFEEMVQRVQRGLFSRNLSKNFVERARFDVDHDKIAGLVALGLDQETHHPTDSHPLTRLRIEYLGLNPEHFVRPDVFKRSLRPNDTIVAPSDSIDEIEETLTQLYQEIVSHRLGVDDTDAAKAEVVFSRFLGMLLAKMVLADGRVDDDEIRVAQDEASKYDAAFDAISFREYCRHPEVIPETEKLIHWGNLLLTEEGATRLKKVLKKIALADGEYHELERQLFAEIDYGLVGAPGDASLDDSSRDVE